MSSESKMPNSLHVKEFDSSEQDNSEGQSSENN